MTIPDSTQPLTFTALSEQPVFLFCHDPALAEGLALELRHHGLRIRVFVHLEVLRTAVRNEPPLAVVADAEALTDLVAPLIPHAPPQQPTALFFFGPADFESRLQAVRWGGDGYFPHPVNHSALLHRLIALATAAAHRQLERVLLVDGPEQNLQRAAQALEAAGLQVDYLSSPGRALDILAQEEYNLLLVHETLAQMRGSELLQVVRQSWRFHALPAILLTQSDKRALDAEATAAGADAVLGLPVAAADLVAVARAKLARARQLFEMYGYSIRRDPGTGLFKRDYFLAALRQALSEAAAGHGRATLLWLELEAPQAGQVSPEQRAQVAHLLQRHLPPLALAAALTQESMAILLPAPDGSALESQVELLRNALRQLQGFSCRLGATLLSSRQRNAAEALELARQLALQREDLPAANAVSGSWAALVREALRESRFRLVYQPIASLSGQPSSYYEVFIRMVAEDGRDILPQEFLAAVEAAGLAEALDRWVLARAVDVLESQRHLRDQPTLFIKLFPDSVARGAELIAWLAECIQAAELEPARFVLQIRQQCADTQPAKTQQLIAAARQLGCQVALEHFKATGESGRQLLQTLRPDFVRLDSQLTQDIGTNIEHQRLAEMIAGQCRAVDAKPIAALVQDALHLSVLWRCGIEYIQGYFMQEPADVFAADETLS